MFARPGLPSFDYVRPSEREEVVSLLGQHGTDARLLMGGTDLFPRMRDGSVQARVVVDVKHLPGMCEIRYDGRTGLSVGASVNLNVLSRHPDVTARFPLLAQAAESVASYQVRNRATLGGNLCNASPAADTAPAVLLLDARIVLHGAQGEREVPAADFFVGPGRTTMHDAEFMVAVRFPVPPAGAKGTYLKLGRNRAGDLAIAGVAVYGFPDQESHSGYRLSIGLASVAPVPLRVRTAEQVFATYPLGEPSFLLAAAEAAESARPIDDVRASAAYRRAMVRTLALRGLRQVSAQLGMGIDAQGHKSMS